MDKVEIIVIKKLLTEQNKKKTNKKKTNKNSMHRYGPMI
jgi:hypothetical protein